MPVIGVMDAPRATRMIENLLDEITKTGARFTILDVTGVDSMDTSAAGHLLKLVQAARLLGTRRLVSGISAQVADSAACAPWSSQSGRSVMRVIF